MSRSYTRAELRTRARAYADHSNDSYPADAVLNDWADVANGEYFALLVENGLGHFAETSQQWTTDGLTGVQAITAANLGRLKAVEFRVDTTTWEPVPRMHELERADFTLTSDQAEVFYFDGTDTIVLLPRPSSGKVYRVRYIARPAKMTSDSDTIEGFEGLEDYIPRKMALDIKIAEESDIRPYVMMLDRSREEINRRGAQRMLLRAGRIHDTDQDNYLYRRWGPVSYPWPMGDFA